MKKIMAAVDALNFSEHDLKNYIYLAEKARGELTILFLENLAGEAILLSAVYEGLYAESVKARQEKSRLNRKRLVDFYRHSCMDVTIRSLEGDLETALITESRFADLLLIKNATSFTGLSDANPPRFIRELLSEAQCPVLMVPDTLYDIEEIIFTYNGTFSSMFAIRQFIQVFDGLGKIPVKVVYISDDEGKRMPNGNLIRDYLGHHFEDIKYLTRGGTAAGELMALTLHKTNAVMTFGAYGRSKTSLFFHRSDVDSLLRTANAPLFITHP